MRFEFKIELVVAKLEDTDSLRVITLKKKNSFITLTGSNILTGHLRPIMFLVVHKTYSLFCSILMPREKKDVREVFISTPGSRLTKVLKER